MYCEECLKEGHYIKGQAHHITLRSQAPYMVHIPINIAYLCTKHHTESPSGIHHNAEMMLKYKQELELKLNLMFTKEFYTYREIRDLLECSDNSTKAVTKTLPKYKEGFKTEELIRHMMGGRSYLLRRSIHELDRE